MFDLALHHLTDGERERDAAADIRRRQVLKSGEPSTTRESRPATKPSLSRIGFPRAAER